MGGSHCELSDAGRRSILGPMYLKWPYSLGTVWQQQFQGFSLNIFRHPKFILLFFVFIYLMFIHISTLTATEVTWQWPYRNQVNLQTSIHSCTLLGYRGQDPVKSYQLIKAGRTSQTSPHKNCPHHDSKTNAPNKRAKTFQSLSAQSNSEYAFICSVSALCVYYPAP